MARLSIAVVIVALAALAAPGAGAFTATGSIGINASNATRFVDPDEQTENIANGAGPSVSAGWGDRAIPDAPLDHPEALAAPPKTAPFPEKLFAPSFIIGGKWQYPPSRP